VPRPAPVAARPVPEEVEITIEAEPPPEEHAPEPLPSFDGPGISAAEPRKDATMLGLGAKMELAPPPAGLPPPPAGMPLPAGLPPPPAGMPLPARVHEPERAAAPEPPLKPGEPYEPVAYAAIAKLTREIIEKIVWEVVPDLAERIIREELDRLVENRRAK